MADLMLTIPMEYYGKRMDTALALLLPQFSRSQLSGWLKVGHIQVNRQIVKPKDKVLGGEIIQILLQEEKKVSYEPENIALNIAYEDDDILVVNKPAGLVVHPGAGNYQHTLVNGLLFHYSFLSQLPRAGIVHRLDKDTTGLLIVAKNLIAHTALIRQMQERSIKKTYLALVHGHVITGDTIQTFYGRHPHNRLKMAVLKQGREAITQYTLNKSYHYFTLLNVQLLTGRTHQIRVHMAHIHHAIVGDPLYSSRTRIPERADESLITLLQQFKRQALHANQLSFTHPISGEPCTISASLPEDFSQLLNALNHYADTY